MTAQYATVHNTSSEAVGSVLLSNNGDFNLNSNNLNITGSTIGSQNGKTTVNIANNLTLTQSEDNYSLTNKSFNTSVGMQIGTAGYQPNQLTVGFSDHESEQTNYNKSVILGDGTGVKAGKTDESQNNLKDYTMINADSDATMSIDLRVVTEAGRKSIGDDLNNIKTGKFITDNVNVMKTNVNTVKNLVNQVVNNSSKNLTLEGTYNNTQKNFSDLQRQWSGDTTLKGALGESANKAGTYDRNYSKDGTDSGKMSGFNDKTNDVIGINTNKEINPNNGSIINSGSHEAYHNKFGKNEAYATQNGNLNEGFHESYNGKYGFKSNDTRTEAGDLGVLNNGYVDGVKDGEVDPAYVAKRPLGALPWLGVLSSNPIDSYFKTEIAHEHLFFEDAQGGNIGYHKGGTFTESGEILKTYRPNNERHYDDALARQAVQNINAKPYSVLGGFDSCKYNCQNWINDFRDEYSKLEIQQKTN